MLSSLHILFLLACVFDPLVFASNFKFELAKKLCKFQIHLFTSTSVANDMLKNFGTFNVLAFNKNRPDCAKSSGSRQSIVSICCGIAVRYMCGVEMVNLKNE